MLTVACIIKRNPGMAIDEFFSYYRSCHVPLMDELIKDKGSLSHEHFPD